MQHIKRFFIIVGAISLIATSCYKDDIDNLQKQIDKLTGSSITTIDSQIKNINTSISDLQSVKNSLSGYITSLQSENSKIKGQIEDLTSVDKNLSVKIDELKSFVNGELKSSKDWANATFATLAQYDSLATVIAGIPAKIEAINKALGDAKSEITANYEKAIKDAVSASEESMKSWVNEKLTDYYTIAQLNATLDSLGQARSAVDSTINAKIDEQKVALDTAKSQITAAYQAAIKTAVDSLEGKLNTKLAQDIATAQSTLNGQITAINTEITNIKSRLDAAEANIEALINQIQSISVVPTYNDGSVNYTGEVDTISFDIKPESAAEALANAWKNASATERASMISFRIVDVLTKGQIPSATVDTVFFKESEFKVGVIFENLPEHAMAAISICSGKTDIASDYFSLSYTLPEALRGICFTALEDGATVGMSIEGTFSPDLVYSSDGMSYQTWDYHTITLANAGDKVYIKAGNTGNTAFNFPGMTKPIYIPAYKAYFTTTQSIKLSGNIMTLLNGLATATSMTDENQSCFRELFKNTTVSDASELILPVDTLASNCYHSLFKECTSLTAPPALPATKLGSNCYESMFEGCTNLTTPPTLSATKIASSCYTAMFKGCSNLTSAPELPADTLVNDCYHSMFEGCTKLSSAPDLPAEVVPYNSYEMMFKDCTSLLTAPAMSANTMDFYSCYRMFEGCSNLTTAPILSPAVLAEGCYYQMFLNCSKITSVTMLATDVTATDCLKEWLSGAGTGDKILFVASGMSGNATISSNSPGWTIQEEE